MGDERRNVRSSEFMEMYRPDPPDEPGSRLTGVRNASDVGGSEIDDISRERIITPSGETLTIIPGYGLTRVHLFPKPELEK